MDNIEISKGIKLNIPKDYNSGISESLRILSELQDIRTDVINAELYAANAIEDKKIMNYISQPAGVCDTAYIDAFKTCIDNITQSPIQIEQVFSYTPYASYGAIDDVVYASICNTTAACNAIDSALRNIDFGEPRPFVVVVEDPKLRTVILKAISDYKSSK